MTRLEQSPQFASNGHGENYGLSPKDIRRFVHSATQSPVPDIDNASAILPMVREFYRQLGVPKPDREKLTQTLETMLYEGTAKQQVQASKTLLSLKQTHNALKETFPGRRRVR